MQDPHRQSALARIKKELLVPQDGLQARVMEARLPPPPQQCTMVHRGALWFGPVGRRGRLPRLRSSVLKEKNAIEDQLNTLTQSQVLQARKAMLTLGQGLASNCATHNTGSYATSHMVETVKESFRTRKYLTKKCKQL